VRAHEFAKQQASAETPADRHGYGSDAGKKS